VKRQVKTLLLIYRSSMLWWSSRTLTKLKSQSQKRLELCRSGVILVLIFHINMYWYFRSLKRFWDCDFNFVNVLELHQSMEERWINKRVLTWRFTLVLIKINYEQIGDQTITLNWWVIFYPDKATQASTLTFVRLSGTSENWRRTSRSCITVVRRDKWKHQRFSNVPVRRTNLFPLV
jgi:hypothetical protein